MERFFLVISSGSVPLGGRKVLGYRSRRLGKGPNRAIPQPPWPNKPAYLLKNG